MQIHNNRGELIGETNVIIRPDGGTVTTNTIYSSTGRVLTQNMSTRNNRGNVSFENILRQQIDPMTSCRFAFRVKYSSPDSVAIQLDLPNPLGAFWQFRNRQAVHRLNESGLGFGQ
jgi:hypothetical protein